MSFSASSYSQNAEHGSDKINGLTVAPVLPASMSADLRGSTIVVISASSAWPSWGRT